MSALGQRHGPHPFPGGGWCFEVWAPCAGKVDLHVRSPRERMVAMEPRLKGYFRAFVEDLEAGSRYRFLLDGHKERVTPSVCPPAGRWRKVLDSSDGLWMGPGGTAPDSLEGGRETALILTPRSLVVYVRQRGAPPEVGL